MRANPTGHAPAIPSATEPAGSRDLKPSGTHATGLGTESPPGRQSPPAANRRASTSLDGDTLSLRGRRRRVLEVELAGHASLLRGPGARELVVEATGRPPTFIPRLRGFSVQESTARDVIAAGEVRGYDIVVTGPRVLQVPATVPNETVASLEVPDPARGLW